MQQHNFGQNRSISLISLDIGKTAGVARKSKLGSFTPGLDLSLNKALIYVTNAIRVGAPTLLVVGHPVTLTGKRSLQTRAVENAVKIMRQRLKIPIVLWDERLTTKWARAPQHCDVAAWILRSFLNAVISGRPLNKNSNRAHAKRFQNLKALDPNLKTGYVLCYEKAHKTTPRHTPTANNPTNHRKPQPNQMSLMARL